MAKILGLPKLSPTMEEGTLSRWAKKEGDEVNVDDLLAEVETDKAVMEFRSFDKGVLLKILAPEGSTLQPDAPVAILGSKGENIDALLASVPKGTTATPATSSEPTAESGTSKATEGGKAPGAGIAETAQKQADSARVAPLSPLPSGGRVIASPVVRKLAREQGISLSAVRGSGPRGRIIKRDLQNAPRGSAGAGLAGTSAMRTTYTTVPDRVERVSQMRKTIARRLTQSKQEVPHFYLTIDVDAEPLVTMREQLNAELATRGAKVSVNDLLIRACAIALRRVPEANASFMGDTIVYHGRVDISVAVAIADGLVTPVVRNADQKDVVEISNEVRSLAARAKERKLRPEEMADGTFSISNLGMFGIENFSAVINPPEGAILAVGATREEPVVKNGQIVPGKRLRMTMSCDHRVVDGAVGAKWLAELQKIVERPIALFI